MPAAPAREIGHVVDGPAWWHALEYESTPELRWPLSVEVFDKMRRTDAQVASVLRAVTLPVRRTQWRVDPNGARPEVARLVAEDLGLPLVGGESIVPVRMRDRFSWIEHLRLALLMLPIGHSFFEQVYRMDGGLARLRKLAPRPARSIQAVNVASDGGLVSIEQWGSGRDNRSPVVIPVDRLVAYVHEKEGGNWLGQSILRTCYKNWLLKDRLLRVQAQTVERNGMGVPLYQGAEGEEDLSAGLEMAKAWRGGDAAGAAVPNGADLLLRGVEGDLPDADAPIRYHDEQIARAVLAHFLNLGTQTGSWALGTTFADFFTLSLQSVAQQVADTATQHIVEDLVDLNWGEDEPSPRITFDEIGSRHTATAEAIKALVDAGALSADQSIEEHLRNAYGLPPSTDAPTPVPEVPAVPDEPVPVAAARVGQVDTSFTQERESYRVLSEGALRDLFLRQRVAVESGGELSSDWDGQLTQLVYTLNRAVARDIGERTSTALGNKVRAAEFDPTVMDAWLLENARLTAERINSSTRQKLAEPPDDADDPVSHVFGILADSGAAMYATTMVTVAANFAAKEAARAAGVARKMWQVNSSSPRSSHASMDGQTVPVGEPFSNGMDYPGDFTGGADEVAGCQCSMVLL